MEIVLGIVLAAGSLAAIVLAAKKFLKPVQGTLPDCCGARGNRDVSAERRV